MKKNIWTALLGLFIGIALFSSDFVTLDTMIDDGRHKEALKILKSKVDNSNPDTGVLWRIGWAYYESVDNLDSKSTKIAESDLALNYLKPYLELNTGDKLERAKIIFWYAVIYSLRGQEKGIFESLGSLPDIIMLCRKSISLAPTFASPYHLMGMIGEAVPIGEYSDKFVMGENFSLAIKYDPDNITILVDSARSIMKRNWDKDKKSSQRKKYKRSDGTPNDMSDKQYAKVLLEEAIRLYENRGKELAVDIEKYNEAKKLIKKL